MNYDINYDGMGQPIKLRIFIEKSFKNPSTIKTELSRGGIEYRLPNGQGVRYNADGSFSGFLDLKRGNNS